jgi:hypothetical protein
VNDASSTTADIGSVPVSPERESSAPRWREFGLYMVMILVCALTLSKNQPDPDFWGHVQYGRDMWSEGLPRTITYSYTSEHHPWVNHEILSELLMSLGVDTLGAPGVLSIKCLLGIAVMGVIMARASRRRVSMVGLVTLVMLVSINLMHFWLSRPQLLSYVLFTLLLLVLARSFTRWPLVCRHSRARDKGGLPTGITWLERDTRWLWWAAPLMAVWANSHGGFVAGFAVLTVFLAVRAFEAWWLHAWTAWPLLLRFAGVTGTCATATLLNPYGIRLHVWLWGSLSAARPEIIEWRPPDLLHVAWIPWWLFAGLSAFVLAGEIRYRMASWRNANRVTRATRGRKRIGLAELTVLLLILWQAIEHRRNIPFFVIAVGIWLPTQFDQLFARLRSARTKMSSISHEAGHPGRRFGVALVVVALVVAAALFNQLRVMPVMRSVYPVAAFQYMADQNLHGRLITRFMWAQYAIGAFGQPRGDREGVRLAFDGRFRTCYPQELVDMYFDFALGDHPTEPRNRSPKSPPIDGSRLLHFRDPDLVLVDRNQPHPLRLMAKRRDDWVLLYQDELAQLWGWSAKYGDPASPLFVPTERRQITQAVQEGFVAWPAFPTRPPLKSRSLHASESQTRGKHEHRRAAELDTKLGFRSSASSLSDT